VLLILINKLLQLQNLI